MNSIRHNANKLTTAIGLLVICSSLLVACGGSSDSSETIAGIGGTGIVSGKITGFGSVYVNGSRYEIGTSQIIVDGEGNKSESDLKLGMVVRLEVETENGVFTDKAIEVVYDDEVQGPVEATPVTSPDGKQRTFNILGQMITVDDISTLFEGTSFGAIDQDDVLEISGFRAATGIIATYVKLKVTTEAELQGTISAPLTVTSFMIGSVTVTYDATDLPAGLILQVDQNVEVKGIFQSQTAIEATEIDLEDDDFGDEVDDISLQGIVSGFATGGISNFFIGNQNIDASGAPTGLTLMDGLNIEVEGEIVGSTLFADEVELRDGDSKLRAFIDTINAPDFLVHFPVANGPTTVTVRTDSQTLFEDETDAPVTSPFSIDDLNSGMVDFVRVEGTEIAGNVVLATAIKRIATVVSGDPSPEDKLELEGKVDGFNFSGGNGTINVLGIEYQLESGTTTYEPTGSPPPIAVDDFVEVEDKDELGARADGIADEVEKE